MMTPLPVLPTMNPQWHARHEWSAGNDLQRPFITILISFVIALIPQLRALFVEVDGTHIPPVPDGDPPLAFVFDAASFVGIALYPSSFISSAVHCSD
jgi:hypothetical protein